MCRLRREQLRDVPELPLLGPEERGGYQRRGSDLRSGGIPETEFLANGHGRLKSIAFAAKYCIAHKGILLPRERKHLLKMGFDGPELAEITFCCGHIHANNMLMVSLIEQNCPVEEMLRGVGPFGESGESTWWVD